MLLPLHLNLPTELCGELITENGLGITTEDGDRFATECFVPPTPAPSLTPGRVIKRPYPYWQKPRRKPYWETDQNVEEDEELLVIAGIEMD